MPPRRKQQYRHLPAFILLALAENPVHGGAILSTLTARMPGCRPDSAAVYRTLQQLEQDGEVISAWETTGPGPAKKLYRLTDAGWAKLEEWRTEIETRVANLRYFLDTWEGLKKKPRK